jgi:methyl coenzyme M reductase gamma subunit
MSYNGYTDYATWRVSSDLFNNIEFSEPVSADDLIEMATEMVFDNYEMKQGSHNVEEYARVFLALPNYNEIANLINEEIQVTN